MPELPAKVVLIGVRATGKSTVGRLLAQRLGVPFIDLDELLVTRFGCPIAEVVASRGWAYFREAEREALKEMLEEGPLVLACGGGAVFHQEEMESLRREALVVWLRAPKEVIAKRLTEDAKTSSQRPSLTGKDVLSEIEEILKSREPLYRRFSHFALDTASVSPEGVVAKILGALKERA